MQIKTVSIIGLGALGILYAHHLSKRMPKEDLRIIADSDRIEKYQNEGIYCNGERCDFNYITPDKKTTPADLIIFTVKYNGLADALKAVANQVGENTIFLSALNGIISEEIIAEVYGSQKVLYCVAQAMDAVKIENHLNFQQMGLLCFGDREPGIVSDKVKAVDAFFNKTQIPHEVLTDMKHKLWSKLMLNVGVNQTSAVYKTTYGGLYQSGSARDMMIAAMREVMLLSKKEGVDLTEADLEYWMETLRNINPLGKPSMRQDVDAKRPTEVELFSGTILALGSKHGIATPVNQMLYNKIKEIENRY